MAKLKYLPSILMEFDADYVLSKAFLDNTFTKISSN